MGIMSLFSPQGMVKETLEEWSTEKMEQAKAADPLMLLKNASEKGSVRALSPGEMFRGEVRDVTGTKVTIQAGQETIEARFDSRVPISIGEVLPFVVRENSEDKFVIAPSINSSMSAEDQMLYKALDAAGLPSTDKNIDIVSALLKNQMPVNSETVKQFLAYSLQNPEAPIEDLVLLSKYQIPVTEESLKQLAFLKQSGQQFSDEVKNLAAQVPEVLDGLLSAGKEEKANELYSKLFPDEGMENGKEPAGVSLKAAPLPILEKEVLLKQLLEQWSVSPEEIKEGKTPDFFHKMTHTLFNIMDFSVKEPVASGIAQAALPILDQMAFFADLNQGFQGNQKRQREEKALTKLPVRLKNGTADLYVYSRKQGRVGSGQEEVSLLLHLDLKALKSLNIMIRLKRKDLGLTFSAEDAEAKQVLKTGLPELTGKLKEKGFYVNALVEQNEKALEEGTSDFFEQEEKNHEVKRYAFDMRI